MKRITFLLLAVTLILLVSGFQYVGAKEHTSPTNNIPLTTPGPDDDITDVVDEEPTPTATAATAPISNTVNNTFIITGVHEVTVNEVVTVPTDVLVTDIITVDNDVLVTEIVTLETEVVVVDVLTEPTYILITDVNPVQTEVVVTDVVLVDNEVVVTEIVTVSEEVLVTDIVTVDNYVPVTNVVLANSNVVVTDVVLVDSDVVVTEIVTQVHEVVVTDVVTANDEVLVTEIVTQVHEVVVTDIVTVDSEVPVTEIVTQVHEVVVTDIVTVNDEVLVTEMVTQVHEVAVTDVMVVDNDVLVTDVVTRTDEVAITDIVTVSDEVMVTDVVTWASDVTVIEVIRVDHNIVTTKVVTQEVHIPVTKIVTYPVEVVVTKIAPPVEVTRLVTRYVEVQATPVPEEEPLPVSPVTGEQGYFPGPEIFELWFVEDCDTVTNSLNPPGIYTHQERILLGNSQINCISTWTRNISQRDVDRTITEHDYILLENIGLDVLNWEIIAHTPGYHSQLSYHESAQSLLASVYRRVPALPSVEYATLRVSTSCTNVQNVLVSADTEYVIRYYQIGGENTDCLIEMDRKTRLEQVDTTVIEREFFLLEDFPFIVEFYEFTYTAGYTPVNEEVGLGSIKLKIRKLTENVFLPFIAR